MNVLLGVCVCVVTDTDLWPGSMWIVFWLSSTSPLIKGWGETTSTLCRDACTPSTCLKGELALSVFRPYLAPRSKVVRSSVCPATTRQRSSPWSQSTTERHTWISLWWAAVNRARAPVTSCGNVSSRTWANCSGGLEPPTGSIPGETETFPSLCWVQKQVHLKWENHQKVYLHEISNSIQRVKLIFLIQLYYNRLISGTWRLSWTEAGQYIRKKLIIIIIFSLGGGTLHSMSVFLCLSLNAENPS